MSHLLPTSDVELALSMVLLIIVGSAWVFGKLWLAARRNPELLTHEEP